MAGYTPGADIGDLDPNEQPEDAYARQRERAPWGGLSTHRFITNSIIELPFGKGRTWMNDAPAVVEGVLGGWMLSGIYSYERGNFLTPLWTGPDPTGTRFAGAGQRAIVTLRPDALRDPNLDDPTVASWFTSARSRGPPVGLFGTSRRE